MAQNDTEIDLAELKTSSSRSDDKKIEEAGGNEAKKRSTILIFLIPLVFVMVVGGGGFFAYTKLFASAAEELKPGKAAKAENPGKEGAVGPMMAFQPFVVNLAGNGGKRYMKLNLEAELSSPEQNEELKKRLPQVRDAIILLLSSKNFADIQDIGGKNKLREELISRVNGLLKTGKIRNVYFTEFVVQ